MAWAYYEFHEDLFKGETVEEWVPLSGKMGEGQEGNINVILSLQVGFVCCFFPLHSSLFFPLLSSPVFP